MNQHAHTPETGFFGLGIAPKLLEMLDRSKFHTPTPIQHKAIPVANEGKDIIGVAQTGTGKTLAFSLPMIQHLAQTKGKALVLLPTRELAMQVDEVVRKFGHSSGIKTVVLIGGASMFHQQQTLKTHPRVLIATPGRLIDHLEQKSVSLSDVNMLVLDEADRMLDMGFQPQIERILRSIPKIRQTMLFSATMPKEILAIANSHMKLPIHVEIAPPGTTAERVTQEVFIVKKDTKLKLLQKLLAQYHGTVLLFCRTKVGARKVAKAVKAMGHRAADIHSDRSLSQRREALEGFKSGKYRVLVATDIASRGIDVTGIEVVINFDLPDDIENYVHRIGRTGRIGREGHAISFATPEQRNDIRNIEKLIRTAIPVSQHSEIPAETFEKPPAPFIPAQFRRKKHKRFF